MNTTSYRPPADRRLPRHEQLFRASRLIMRPQTSSFFLYTLYLTERQERHIGLLTLVTRCVIREALRKKVFFITTRWLDKRVHTSQQRVSVVATSSNVDTESGTNVSSTGRRMGGGLCSLFSFNWIRKKKCMHREDVDNRHQISTPCLGCKD